MTRRLFRIGALLTLVASVLLECSSYHARNDVAAPTQPLSVVAEPQLPVVGRTVTLDITGGLDALWSLPEEERREQIADWAVLAALDASRSDTLGVRDATFTTPPLRLPELAEAYGLQYGPGRHVARPDGSVWLFVSRRDPHRRVSLAREADRVRMELGEWPQRFVVFEHEGAIREGALRLTRREDIPGSVMASPAWGYSEHRVTDARTLAAALGAIDSVTYASHDGRAVIVGGRQLAEARSLGVDAEDIAALYQAHQTLASERAAWEAGARVAGGDLLDRFNQLVDEVNSLERARSLLRRPQSFGPGLFRDNLGLSRPRDARLTARIAELGREVGVVVPSDEDDPGVALDRVRPAVRAGSQAAQDAYISAHPPPPHEPGFSLDPRFDDAGLRRDVRLLASSPTTLVLQAIDESATRDGRRWDAVQRLLWLLRPDDESLARVEQARDVAAGVPSDMEEQLRSGQSRITLGPEDRRQAAELARLASRRDLEGLHVALYGDLSVPEERRDSLGRRLIRYVRERNRLQCARYDGPLGGTDVGMTLFYTDLLAKLWAGIDRHHSAPVAEVPGFAAIPVIGPEVEPAYRDEMARMPNTRLWFAPRDDRFATTSYGALVFAPSAARVYSAGSDPHRPGEEATPNEESRRSFGWWDRHFEEVAAYEPEYHRLSEILKWSIITGWLNREGLLRDALAAPAFRVRREWEFDDWYRANRSRLRYQASIPFIPRNRWGQTECLEIAQSYPYRSGGEMPSISGGVTAGGASSLTPARRLTGEVPVSLRRGALAFDRSRVSASGGGTLRTVTGSELRLAAARSGVASTELSPAESTRFRVGPRDLARTLGSGATTDVRAGAAGATLRMRAREGGVEIGRVELRTQGTAQRLEASFGPVAAEARGLAAAPDTGSAAQALRRLGSALADGGSLADALAAARRPLESGAAARAQGIGRSPAARLFLDGVLPTSSADQVLARALGELRAGRAESAGTLLAQARTAGARVQVPDTGPNTRTAQAVLQGAQWRASGFRLLSERRAHVPASRPASTDASAATLGRQVRQGEAVVYVQDRRLLEQIDADICPAESLARARRRSGVSIRSVSVDDLGSIRASAGDPLPDIIRDEQTGEELFAVSRPLSRPGVRLTTIVVVGCDRNGDGRTDETERRACLGG